MQLIPDILLNTAAERPAAPAVWFNGVWHHYGQIATAAVGFSAFLKEIGVRPGDRVAIVWENSTDYITAHFGCLASGAVEVSLNTELRPGDIAALLNDCEVSVLIASGKLIHRWGAALSQVPMLRHLVTDFTVSDATHLPASLDTHRFDRDSSTVEWGELEVPAKPDDLASIVYTSGSTGQPKGVMLSHRNLCSNTQSIVEYLKLTPEDRMMVVLPFHYIYGRSLLYTHFLSGGSIVLDNRFAFPAAILKTMVEQEVTCFAGVPSTYSILLRKTDFARRKFPKLRLLTQAGGALAPALQREIRTSFPNANLFVMYGSTEASPRLTYLPPEWLDRKLGSIGMAIPGVDVFVADQEGNELPHGQAGEVLARGPNIMLGYWNNPGATQQVLRNGIYYTGDLGYKDPDGCIFLTGRSRDFIKPGGNRVSSLEVEERISEIPGVVEVAVFGVPDDLMGEAIKAVIVTRDESVTASRVREYLQSKLALYKIPTRMEFTDALPKNNAGKVLKTELLERHRKSVSIET